MDETWDLIVVGAGAAGMLAAARASRLGLRTLLLEKNNKPGVKILMSGGTRCNLTHDTDEAGMLAAFQKRQARFLRTAIFAFPPQSVVDHFASLGVSTKIESTGKVFPESNRAYDVQQALWRDLLDANVDARLNNGVNSIRTCLPSDASRPLEGEKFEVCVNDASFTSRRLLVTTGGRSYPGCGTTGDGYAWLKEFGHEIIPTRPALVPLVASAGWIADLSGLTLEDTELRVVPVEFLEQASDPEQLAAVARKRQIAERRSSLLFTHFGLSGPAAMDVSGAISSQSNPLNVRLLCDFLPDLSVSEVIGRIKSQAQSSGQQSIGRTVSDLLPTRLSTALLLLSDVPCDRRLAELGKPELHRLVSNIKTNSIAINSTRGFPKAEVTAGGVKLSEVNPKTMESKCQSHMYIAGELLDVDGRIGGYNFQAAFSTGWLAATKMVSTD